MGLKALTINKLANVKVTHIKKNDLVLVMSGKDKGKKSRVIEVDRQTGKARVEGIAMLIHHMKPNPTRGVKGGIIEREAFIDVSKLKLIKDS